MSGIPMDPFERGGIEAYGKRLRDGKTSALETTQAFLDRIAALDPQISAFQYLAADQALECAGAVDALLASGTDLGPLMGVPVAVKDLFAVEGMPTTAGTRLNVADLIGEEGSFVKALKRAGCVILGKTRTVEFAFGINGPSQPRGTPWNPWDSDIKRLTGGSSTGSAAAVAAGMCGFAIGSDTGGSVRVPAAMCGISGLKTTWGLWPADGVFPLARHLDTIGPLTRSAADAEIVFAALSGQAKAAVSSVKGLKLGCPDYLFQNLGPEVEAAMADACATLEAAGAVLSGVDHPEAAERETYFPTILPVCLISVLGRERYEQGRTIMDPVVSARSARGLEEPGWNVLRLEQRRAEISRIVDEKMRPFDAWISPSAALTAVPVSDLSDVNKALETTMRMSQNSQPGNLFGLCGAVLPVPIAKGRLPVGFQVMCRAGEDARAVAVARAIEEVFGRAESPDLSGFVSSSGASA
ncbi:MAG: amidase [Rhodospirillales bacterium]|jgi:aspartyl-tRNA(Asn)/glutamyl-tRNA(Gln) amidotransferase subunit A|nr:amidase [Rhodospirillales bacterium]